MLNKHRILLTENFCRALDYQISFLAIANRCGRDAVAYGLTCSQACYTLLKLTTFVCNILIKKKNYMLLPISSIISCKKISTSSIAFMITTYITLITAS